MAYSSLVTYTKLSWHKGSRNGSKIDTIAIHCMAGNLSVETCGKVFSGVRAASSNYGIGSDGRIALYVDEQYRSMCTSSAAIDRRAITIEVANDGGAPDWHVSDKAMASLINLLVDICKRNPNIGELRWQGKKSLIGQVSKQNMVVHRWVAAKACPGNYLYNKHPWIVEQVNSRLKGGTTPVIPTPGTDPFVNMITDFSLVFDSTFYADKYPDLKAVFGNNSAALLNHFKSNGIYEQRQAHPDFSVKVYKEKNVDLQKAFGEQLGAYVWHYVTTGHNENRIHV